MDRPNRHMAGDILVSLSGVLRYCNIARWNVSVSSSPFGPVLSVMSLLTVFTPLLLDSCYVGRQRRRGDGVQYTPVCQELPGRRGSKFRTTV